MEDNSVEMNTGPIKSWMKCTQALIATRLKGIVNGSMLDLQKEMRVNRFKRHYPLLPYAVYFHLVNRPAVGPGRPVHSHAAIEFFLDVR